jgi:hypothetical protein
VPCSAGVPLDLEDEEEGDLEDKGDHALWPEGAL